MTKRRSQSKNALFASGLSLVLCFTMLIGTTFAWFSDSVSNKGNKITAGSLKVGFYSADEENTTLPSIGATTADSPTIGKWTDLRFSKTPIFTMGTTNAPSQPGDKLTKYIAVRNEGNLELKYYLDFAVNDGGLGDAVTFDFAKIAPTTDATQTFTGSQLEAQKVNGSSAVKGEYAIYKMTLTFLESAGNTYQGGSLTVDLNLTATQNKQGARDSLIRAKDASAFSNVAPNSTIVLQKDLTTAESIEINEFVNIDLNGCTLTCKDFSIVKDNTIGTIDVANGKIVADNIKISAEKGSVNVKDLNGTVSETGKVYLNGSMNTINVFGDTSFNVPVTVSSNTKIVVAEDVLAPVSFKVTGENILIENNGIIGTIDATEAGENVYVAGNAPGSISGNINTEAATDWDGITTTEVKPINNVYTVNTANELAWIAEHTNSVANAFSKKTVVLGKDINLNNKAWTPIGTEKNAFNGTFDGMNYTISNLLVTDKSVIGVGTSNPNDPGFAGLFGRANGTIIKNIKINNVTINIATKEYVRSGAIGGMIYTGTIDNCHVSGSVNIYNRGRHAVGGINGYGYTDILNCSVITDGGIINGRNSFTGGITGFLGEGPHKIVNCHVSGVAINGYTAAGICGCIQYATNLVKDCTVTNSKLTGKVSIEDTAEIAFLNPAGTIENCQFINSTCQ